MNTYCLKGSEYNEIEETVNSMFEDLGFTVFPVDVLDLAKRLNIDLIKYSEVSPDERNFFVMKHKDGFSTLLDKKNTGFTITIQ